MTLNNAVQIVPSNQNANRGTILAVDDSPLNIDVLIGILKEHDVIPALSGEEALEILETEQIDLILLDVVMPGMDGHAVAQKVINSEKFKDIPIIFVTVKNGEQDIIQCFESGATDYVAKPFIPVELKARINNHIKQLGYKKKLIELGIEV